MAVCVEWLVATLSCSCVKMCVLLCRSVLNRVAGYFTVDDDSSLQKRIAEETDSDVKLISMLDTTVVKLLQMYQVYGLKLMSNTAAVTSLCARMG